MVRTLAAILLIVTSAYAHAGTLMTRVNGIEEAGIMHLAIYATAVAFENDQGDKSGPADGIIDGVIEAVTADSATYRFELPAGTYAIGLFVDANANGVMDRNLFKIPKEQYGFSNNARGAFGPPSFEDASIYLQDELEIEIDL